MPDTYTAGAVELGTLFRGKRLEVPPYQRAYAWRPAQLREFWDDLTDFARSKPGASDRYFLGAMVFVERPKSYLVLDGQQRLATATMIMAAIRDLLASAGGTWGTEASNLQSDYIFGKVFRQGMVYRLDMSAQDRDLFRRRVQQEGGVGLKLAELYASHKRLNAAYRFIRDQAKAYGPDDDAGLNRLSTLATVLLDHVSVVRCTSTDPMTAATVFETLNSRGITLTTSELVRTWLMSRANTATQRGDVEAAWAGVLSIHDVASVDDFIRHYWVAKHADIKGKRLYKYIREDKDVNRQSPVGFSRELEQAASIYRELAGANTGDRETDASLKGIRVIGAKALYPALLRRGRLQWPHRGRLKWPRFASVVVDVHLA
jgi:uncharacterized protein with ParB-like and HNH nuclease domain